MGWILLYIGGRGRTWGGPTHLVGTPQAGASAGNKIYYRPVPETFLYIHFLQSSGHGLAKGPPFPLTVIKLVTGRQNPVR